MCRQLVCSHQDARNAKGNREVLPRLSIKAFASLRKINRLCIQSTLNWWCAVIALSFSTRLLTNTQYSLILSLFSLGPQGCNVFLVSYRCIHPSIPLGVLGALARVLSEIRNTKVVDAGTELSQCLPGFFFWIWVRGTR